MKDAKGCKPAGVSAARCVMKALVDHPNSMSAIVENAKGGSETVSIKGGTLDNPLDMSSAIHIWTSSKLPGVDIPNNVQQFPAEPD